MDLDPEKPSDVDEPEPLWADEDAAAPRESLWLARARARAARSELHEMPATPVPGDTGAPKAEASAPLDVPASDVPWVAPPAPADVDVPVPIPLAAEPDGPFVEAEVAVHAGQPDSLDENPGTSPAEIVSVADVHGEPEDDRASEPEELELPAPGYATSLAVIAPPEVPGRTASWSVGHLAGVAIAAVGGAVIVLTMLVPRHAPATSTGSVRVPEPGKASVQTPAAHRASAAAAVATPRWRATSEWTGGRRKSVAYELAADRPVRLWMRQVTPVLVVRCLAGSLDAFVVTGSASAIEPGRTDHTVRLTFDDAPEIVERWGDSADRDGLFAPDGRGLLARVASARQLRFTFTPHNAPVAEASFSLAGADALQAPLGKHCR